MPTRACVTGSSLASSLVVLSLATSCIGKDSDAGRDWGQEEKGTTEDEIDGWMASLTQWT